MTRLTPKMRQYLEDNWNDSFLEEAGAFGRMAARAVMSDPEYKAQLIDKWSRITDLLFDKLERELRAEIEG